MPESFKFDLCIAVQDGEAQREIHVFGSNYTCRESVLMALSSSFRNIVYDRSNFQVINASASVEIPIHEINEGYINEIRDIFDVHMSVNREQENIWFTGTISVTMVGPEALPAWYWTVLAIRNGIVQTNERTLEAAIAASDSRDSSCWFAGAEKRSTLAAWRRLKRRNIGPSTAQMMWGGDGPVSWFQRRKFIPIQRKQER